MNRCEWSQTLTGLEGPSRPVKVRDWGAQAGECQGYLIKVKLLVNACLKCLYLNLKSLNSIFLGGESLFLKSLINH